jgi:hypothetical protein
MPKPKLDVDTDVEPQKVAAVQPDTGLLKLYDQLDRSKVQTGTLLAKIVRHIKEHNVQRDVVRATLTARGMSKSSVASEMTRIYNLVPPEKEPILEDLEKGKISVTQARTQAAEREYVQDPALVRERKLSRMKDMLERAARIGYDLYDGQSTPFIDAVQEAWTLIKHEFQSKAEAKAKKQKELDEAEEESGDEEAA